MYHQFTICALHFPEADSTFWGEGHALAVAGCFKKEEMNMSAVCSSIVTEVFPPEDADCIVDNTSTGTTLKENGMEITSTIFRSSTHLVVSPHLTPEKLELVDRIVRFSAVSSKQSYSV